MSKNHTVDEIKSEHLNGMGQELGNAFNKLHNEVILIHLKWSEFEELFGSSEKEISKMNQVAPIFYFYFQNVLFENILLSITNITEELKPRKGNERLTIRLLTKLVSISLKGEIGKLVNEIVELQSFARDWRIRRIAHFDKDLMLNELAEPLEIASREKVNQVLHKIRKLLNTIEVHYIGKSTRYNLVPKDGMNLLELAVKGTRFENLKLKFQRKGKLEHSDFE